LEITDPAGGRVGKDFSTVAGAAYLEGLHLSGPDRAVADAVDAAAPPAPAHH
jgi:hypothetical protein